MHHVQMRTVRQHITQHSLITYHHANTRGSRADRSKIARLCVQKTLRHPTRHVSFLAAPDTDHQHKFSRTYLSDFTVVLSDTLEPVGSRSIFCDDSRRSGGSSDIPSPTETTSFASRDILATGKSCPVSLRLSGEMLMPFVL